jgi:hypothetical protein
VQLGHAVSHAAAAAESHCAPSVRTFALVELGDSESIDPLLAEEDARRAQTSLASGVADTLSVTR